MYRASADFVKAPHELHTMIHKHDLKRCYTLPPPPSFPRRIYTRKHSARGELPRPVDRMQKKPDVHISPLHAKGGQKVPLFASIRHDLCPAYADRSSSDQTRLNPPCQRSLQKFSQTPSEHQTAGRLRDWAIDLASADSCALQGTACL